MSHHERIKKLLGAAASRAYALQSLKRPLNERAREAGLRLAERASTELHGLGCTDAQIEALTHHAALLDGPACETELEHKARNHMVAENAARLRELGIDLSTPQTRTEPDPPCTCATMSFGFSVGPDLNPCCPVHGLNQFLI